MLMPMRSTSTAAWQAQLLSRARAGDQQAFAELVGAHTEHFYTIALHLTGSRVKARGVVQDSVAAAWQHLEAFTGRSTFTT